jgi:pimeloyl-ACP methyl ester carboxylesterase
MADHAADIIALLDAFELERVVLGGHSFGGFLSMYIAARFPERVARLVVIDAGFAMASARTRDQIKPALDRLGQVSPSWEAYLASIKQAPYYSGWWDEAIEDYYRADVRTNQDGSVQPRSRPGTIAAAMDGSLAEPWVELAGLIRQPALLVHSLGAYGPPGAPPVLTADAARETVAAIQDCRYVQVPGNHMTMVFGDGAREMAGAITAFVANEARGTGDDI